MVQLFSWPVTDDQLTLANALDDVMAAYGEVGAEEEAWVREASAKLIVEAYGQGVRDEDQLAHYALKSLVRGRRGCCRWARGA
jgi:hypothetical protein